MKELIVIWGKYSVRQQEFPLIPEDFLQGNQEIICCFTGGFWYNSKSGEGTEGVLREDALGPSTLQEIVWRPKASLQFLKQYTNNPTYFVSYGLVYRNGWYKGKYSCVDDGIITLEGEATLICLNVK